MKTLLIVIAVVVVLLIIKACTSTNSGASNASRPPVSDKPTQLVDNDKLIVIEKIGHDQIKKVLTGFCNMYNQNGYAALPRLYTLANDKFVVCFPYDVDFQTFCFAVNYLRYPPDVTPLPNVSAWTSTKAGDEWITEKSVNKTVMLFVPDNDKEYDNVFLTTQDNIGYKLGFAAGEEKQLLPQPKLNYQAPTIDRQKLKDLKFEDID